MAVPRAISLRARMSALTAVLVVVGTHVAVLALPAVGVSSFAVAVAFGLFVVRGIGISVGYHRLLTHRAFQTSRFFRFLLAFAGALSMQGGPLWWVALDRAHHRDTARGNGAKKNDPRSPFVGGFWQRHLGWLFSPLTYAATRRLPDDLASVPELRLLDRHAFLVALLPIPALFILGESVPAGWNTSGLQLVVCAHVIGVVVSWHSFWGLNSLGHRVGKAGDPQKRLSRNHSWLSLPTFGEAWHRNHHRFPTSARIGLEPRQLDLGWAVIRACEALGLVWNVRRGPRESQRDVSRAPLVDEGEIWLPSQTDVHG